MLEHALISPAIVNGKMHVVQPNGAFNSVSFFISELSGYVYKKCL